MGLKMRLALDAEIPFDIAEAAAYKQALEYVKEMNKTWKPSDGCPLPIAIAESLINPVSASEPPIDIKENFRVWEFPVKVVFC